MIEYVIKRDGSKEEFDPTKLNIWAEWASDTCGVSWVDIIFDAIKTLHNGVSTSDIQKALIKKCVERRTEGHTKMAARLMLGVIYKEAFDDFSIPHLKDYYHHMVEEGFWDDMGYTDEELDILDTHVNHIKDFEYTYATLRQFYDKYSQKSFERCLESPQMAFMGLAMSNMRDEENRLTDVILAYTKMSLIKVNLPTPTLALERSATLPAPSCCLIAGNDTVESIGAATHVAYTMTAKSAGIGFELKTRAPKDPVKNGRISHGGKHSYYSYVDRAVKANAQIVRGGSATVTYNVLDPEIEKLLTMKSQRTDPTYRLAHLDYSMAFNNLFLKKVAKNEDWMLVSCYYAPKLWELSYSGDQEAFEEEYNRVANSTVKKTFVPARSIFVQGWAKQRGDTGRLYLTFLDNINTHTPFKNPIRQSNLCVAPETKILTDRGYTPIVEVAGEKVNVWNGVDWSEVDVVQTGTNQKLLKVTTNSGYELECTPYHKFYIFDGYGKPYKEVRAHELKEGDKLAKFELPVIEGNLELENAYVNGFYSGDGCLDGNGNQRVYLYHDKRKLANEFPKGLGDWYVQEEFNRQHMTYKTLKDKFFVPTDQYSIKTRLEWLAGYLDSDGCVYKNGSNEALTASSVEYEFLKEVQLMLQTLGVSAKITTHTEEGFKRLPANDGTGELKEFWCQDAYRLLITSNDSFKLLQLGLDLKRLQISERLPQRDAKRFVQVKSVIDEGRIDDTYCFTEPKRHMGMFNGILTGQCQEVVEPTEGFDDMSDLYRTDDLPNGEVALCNLGAIVVSNIESDEDYEETSYILAKLIDNTIERGVYPFPAVEKSAKARRSIGVGIVDLAHEMARKGLKYDSQEGRNHIHYIAERHSYFLHKASVRLAKERGKCEWMYRTKYNDERPWLPVDTYNKAVDEFQTIGLRYDWEELRNEIKKHGVRFSVLEAHMPTESSAVFSGCTNGVYPIREKEIFKSSRKGMVYFRAPNADTLEYQNAYHIDHLDLVKVYALIQKFTSQAISSDFYTVTTGEGEKISSKKLLQRVLFAAKLGMKTFYYENFKTGEEVKEMMTIGGDLSTTEEEGCEECKM